MKKNAFLTFIFACIPGAGQMYYGYMQRGLSIVTLFFGGFLLGNLIEPLAFSMLIVWMYSFFDTYDLIRHLAAGDPKPDGLLLIGDTEEIKRFIPSHHKLLGWGLIVVGVWALWANVLENAVVDLLASLLGDWNRAWGMVNAIPTVLVAVALIVVGVWLLGLHPAKGKTADLPPYPDADAAEPPHETEK